MASIKIESKKHDIMVKTKSHKDGLFLSVIQWLVVLSDYRTKRHSVTLIAERT